MDDALDRLESSSAAFFCLLDESTRGNVFRMRQKSPVPVSADAVASAVAVRGVAGRVEGAGSVRAAVGRVKGGERRTVGLLNGAWRERRSHASQSGMSGS